jgi:hypothetical protein
MTSRKKTLKVCVMNAEKQYNFSGCCVDVTNAGDL